MALTGVPLNEMCRYHALLDDACAFVQEHCAVSEPNENQMRTLELLAAVYAFRLYEICSAENITSFTAGDVKITSSAAAGGKAEALWQELCEKNTDLIQVTGFIFGRIVM